MKNILTDIFRKGVTKEQCKDTGMAMVLILLILSLALKGHSLAFVKIAMVVLVVDMTYPPIYRPLAVLWFGLSHLLGMIVSKVLLSIVFFLVVTPVGLIRRFLGKDSMQIKSFKASDASVMVIRNHTFVAEDLEKPY